VSVLLNDGDGTFQAPQPYVTGPGPSAVTASDLNDDGADDLLVANQFDGTVSVLLSTAGGAPRGDPAQAAGSAITTMTRGARARNPWPASPVPDQR